MCTKPADSAGYDVTETNLDLRNGRFSVAVACAAGYEGAAAVAACSTAGDYGLSGCAPIVCTTPAATAGYERTTVRLDLSKGAFDVRVSCASGYEGTAAATPCATSGPYTLSGCDPIVCTAPAVTTGYQRTTVNLDLSSGAFDVRASCASGFSVHGAASITAAGPPQTQTRPHPSSVFS